jgi:hypothetical protein
MEYEEYIRKKRSVGGGGTTSNRIMSASVTSMLVVKRPAIGFVMM